MQFVKSKPDHPIGLHSDDIQKLRIAREVHNKPTTDDAVSKSAKKKAKQKEKKQQREEAARKELIDSVTKGVSEVKVVQCASVNEAKDHSQMTQEEKLKRVKNLNKKIRQVEELESKIASGDIKAPDKDQQEKLNKKQSFIDEIEELEYDLVD